MKTLFTLLCLHLLFASPAKGGDKLNTEFLPGVEDLRTAAQAQFDKWGKDQGITLKPEGQLLFYYAVADQRPLLVEYAVALFQAEGGDSIVCSYWRHPYTKLQMLSGWQMLYAPDYSYSGGVSEIGWKRYKKRPDTDELFAFLSASKHDVKDKKIMARMPFKFIAHYQNDEQLAKLFGLKYVPIFLEKEK